MINFSELQKLDSSLKIISDENWKGPVAGLSVLENPTENSLVFVKEKKYLEKLGLKSSGNNFLNSGIIIAEKLYEKWQSSEVGELDELSKKFGLVAIAKDIDLCMSFISKPFYDLKYGQLNNMVDGRQMETARIHPDTYIAQGVFIGENVEIAQGVQIHPGSVVMPNSKIGENTIIYSNVTIYSFVEIGSDCRIHANVVIGSDGFGYNYNEGVHHKVWHTGGVIIGNQVEIGSTCSVDGGTFAPTKIGNGSKIDNQVQIGHNSDLGKGVVLCGQAGVSGSATLGDFVIVGGKAGIGPGVTVGSGSQVAGNAMVNTSWPPKSTIGGHPARPLKEWLRGVAFVRRESLKK